METKSAEMELLQALFGEQSDSDKMQNAITELNNAIIALHNPKITKSIAMESVRSIQIAKVILSNLNSDRSVKNTVLTK
jgi:ArsR family metal-binding transcriptional regulator